ncbi:hypothetical protein CLOSTMETH_02655 [[Clostridium] methylpentosum DSM 5476]|uniref:Uncharacterized protein n=1 Tax=[Clostridium] methylpentosum DSM 5476 TaxID=537013 RepID=C0EFL3_9FIRM|nr:hypothetical protein CLOSTMETH_02655 [[Clostridium] methylpentosum DSM 5476]
MSLGVRFELPTKENVQITLFQPFYCSKLSAETQGFVHSLFTIVDQNF